MAGPFRNYDSWLESGNPYDRDDDPDPQPCGWEGCELLAVLGTGYCAEHEPFPVCEWRDCRETTDGSLFCAAHATCAGRAYLCCREMTTAQHQRELGCPISEEDPEHA